MSSLATRSHPIPPPPVQGGPAQRVRLPIGSPSFWAKATAFFVFPLIWAGGLVTTHDAGMAVPDWPGTFGYNLLAYPLSTWLFGPFDLFVEHGHRLLGALVGFLSILLLAATYQSRSFRPLRPWAYALLLSVIVQGALGGIRVLAIERKIALIHGCTGPLVFALACYVVIRAGRLRREFDVAGVEQKAVLERRPRFGKLRLFAAAVAVATFGQLVLGASLRHAEVSMLPSQFMALTHMHLTGAVVILGSVAGLFAWVILRRRRLDSPPAVRLAWILMVLVLAQVALGCGTWFVNYALPWDVQWPTLAAHVNQLKGFWESMIVTAHQAVGSLILVTAFVLAVRLSEIHEQPHVS